MGIKHNVQYGINFLICFLVVGMLTGCQKQHIQVVITDGQTETRVDVKTGETVEKALERAEIQVDGKDDVIPERDTKLTQPDTEILITRCADVTVEEGSNIIELEMTGKTVQDALNQVGITLNEHDYLNHNLKANLKDGMHISVVRRIEVTITVDGETKSCLTRADDVESFLEEQHIALDKKDRVSPEKTAVLQEGTRITVERVSVKEITVKEPIEFGTEYEYSGAMYSDQSVEKTPGIEGEKEVTYQVTYVDGKEEKRKKISEKVLKEPVAQVVTKGTKKRKYIVSKERVEDCDGSGHGYYIITWSDGTVEYQDY